MFRLGGKRYAAHISNRNFLLFLPAEAPGLRAVMNYYSSTVTLNAEGDTQLSDETVESLGRSSKFLTILFGSIIRLASPPKRRHFSNDDQVQVTFTTDAPEAAINSSVTAVMFEANQAHFIEGPHPPPESFPFRRPTAVTASEPVAKHVKADFPKDAEVSKVVKNVSLTVLLPDPGYFAAGGIAGVISRTATAPLDRLKVYLIVNTGVVGDSIEAVKKGDAIAAAKHVGRPLIDATKELWKAGGMRSLFAGMYRTESRLIICLTI